MAARLKKGIVCASIFGALLYGKFCGLTDEEAVERGVVKYMVQNGMQRVSYVALAIDLLFNDSCTCMLDTRQAEPHIYPF